jgi:hypothetical protein
MALTQYNSLGYLDIKESFVQNRRVLAVLACTAESEDP